MRLGGAWCYLFIPLGMGGVEGFLGWLRVGWIGAGIGEFYLVQLGVSIGGTLAAFGPTRVLVGLGEYPFFAVWRLAVSPLRRLTFLQAPKKVSKKR